MSQEQENIETPAETTIVVDAFPTESSAEQKPQNQVPAAENEEVQAKVKRSILAHIFSGLGLALARPRVLLVLVCMSLMLALPTAVGVYRDALNGVALLVEHPDDPPLDFLQVAPGWVFGEWQRNSPGLQADLGSSLTPSIIASSLLGLLVCAGFMGITANRKREHSLLSFLREAGAWFFPFFRTWVFGIPLFFAVTWLIWGTPGEWLLAEFLPEGDFAQATSEQNARWIGNSREILYLLSLLVVELCLDLGRAAMVIGNKSSAILAVFRGIGQFMFEPLRALGVVVLGFALELGWMALTLELTRQGLLPVWTLALLLPLGRFACRGARYAALVGLVSETRS